MRINFHLSNDLYKNFANVAEKIGETRSKLLKEWIDIYVLADLEQIKLNFNPLKDSVKYKSFNFDVLEAQFEKLKLFSVSTDLPISMILRLIIDSESSKYISYYLSVINKRIFNDNLDLLNDKSFALVNTNKTYTDICENVLDQNPQSLIFAFNPDIFYKFFDYEYDINSYIPRRVEAGIYAKGLSSHTKYDNDVLKLDARGLRQTKFLPLGLEFRNTIVVYDDTLAILAPEESKAYLTKDQLIVNSVRSFVNNCWDIST